MKGAHLAGRKRREISSNGPPGAEEHVLFDQMPWGRLVVENHVWDVSGLEGNLVSGEGIALRIKLAPGTEHRIETAKGERAIVCSWQPGPRFGPKDLVRVSISADLSISCALRLTGELHDGAAANVRAELECNLLGKPERFHTSASELVREGRARSTATPAHHFVTSAVAELHTGRLSTEPLETSSAAKVHLESARRSPAEVELNVSARWSFAVAIEQGQRSKRARE